MILSDLLESYRLPLISGGVPNARGSYGAFLVTMNPNDFLKLTVTNDEELEHIVNRPFPLDRDEYTKHHSYNDGADFGRYPIPFLKVIFPSGKITGHEGRHRAAMIARNGGDKIPVIIYPYEHLGYEASYKYWDDDEERYVTVNTNPYDNEDEAEKAAYDALNQYPEDDRGDFLGTQVKIMNRGLKQLKGAPERSNSSEYCYAAWTKEDFPDQLIGQFDRTVSVSSNRIKIGKIKGYHHYRC